MSALAGFQGPRRGADRAVLLAHGAGSDMHAAALTTVADALADAGIASLRFDFPYRAAGRKAPDRAPVLLSATREAAAALVAHAGVDPQRVVLGGRSMGGRMCSLLAAGVDPKGVALDGGAWPAPGLVLLGYPLHPPGKPEQLRTDHFPKLRCPVLFVSGTRDSFGTPDEIKAAAKAIRPCKTWHWIETGDHGFKVLKSSGKTQEAVLAAAAARVVEFVTAL